MSASRRQKRVIEKEKKGQKKYYSLKANRKKGQKRIIASWRECPPVGGKKRGKNISAAGEKGENQKAIIN